MTQRFEYSEAETEQDLSEIISKGFPTFDEFRKNPDKYRDRPDHVLESVQNSLQSKGERKAISKQRYFWRYSKEEFALERLEKVCFEEGYTMDQVDVLPFRQAGVDGKDEILVRFFPRHELQAMGAKIPNA